jgi:hypothetical protein
MENTEQNSAHSFTEGYEYNKPTSVATTNSTVLGQNSAKEESSELIELRNFKREVSTHLNIPFTHGTGWHINAIEGLKAKYDKLKEETEDFINSRALKDFGPKEELIYTANWDDSDWWTISQVGADGKHKVWLCIEGDQHDTKAKIIADALNNYKGGSERRD